MIFSDVIRNMITAINAVNNNDPNALLIADQVALQMVQYYPLVETKSLDKGKIFRVWSNGSYEIYTKLDPQTRLTFWRTGGPYAEYIKSKKFDNGIPISLEKQLENGKISSTSSSNNTSLIFGIIGATILGLILIK